MKFTIISIVTVCSLLAFSGISQTNPNDPVIMTLDGKPVLKSEFLSVYNKNNGKDVSSEKKSVKDYLNLFINFKLKVLEAQKLGLDTGAAFKQELGGYQKQLSAPYLTDKEVTDKLVVEAYDRNKTEVNASHILVKCTEDALPKDTLEAWQRITIIKNMIAGVKTKPNVIAEYEINVKANRLSKKSTARDSQEVHKLIATIKDLQSESAIIADLRSGKKISDGQFKTLEAELRKNHFTKTKPSLADTMEVKNIVAAVRKWASSNKLKDVFGFIARGFSDDPSASDNNGNLGYFTALEMVFPFENAAYNTAPGSLSGIVRTKFGFHVLEVLDKRPNPGEILCSHIMIRLTKEMKKEDSTKAKQKIDEIYQKLKAGEKFSDLAKTYSEDKQTNSNGGQLSWFTERKFGEATFAKNAFALKNNGDYTTPFITRFGWHIIKRDDWRGIPTFDAMKTELRNKVSKDSRSYLSKTSFLAKIKKEYNFKDVAGTKEVFYNLIDSNYFKGTWKANSAANLKGEMFTLADKKYTQKDFADFLESHQTRRPKIEPGKIVEAQYKNFVDETCLNYEESQLDKKYPDYHNLMQEYRDGILLFDLTDKKVWSKAVKDTIGMTNFYEKNKNNYLWGERADVSTWKCTNAEIAKEVRKLLEKKKSEKDVLEKINKNSQLNVAVEDVMYLKGENKNVDANWKEGVSPEITQDGKIIIVQVNKILSQSPKKLPECRGMVTADYQNYLEKEWVEELRKDHKVVVDQTVLSTIQ